MFYASRVRSTILPKPSGAVVLAADEWTRAPDRSDVRFTLGGFPLGVGISASTGITYVLPVTDDAEFIAAHNAEVNRLVRAYGLPRGSRSPWVGLVVEPVRAWRGATQSPVTLRPERPLRSPDGRVLLQPGRTVHDACRVWLNGKPAYKLRMAVRDEGQLGWGPAGSDLLTVRSSTASGARYTVYDLRSGYVLNEVDVDR